MKLVNKLLGIVALLVLMVSSVTAGNIEDVDVDARFSFRHGWVIDKISGDIDADTLNGMTAEEISYDDSKVIKKINKVNNKVKSNDDELSYLFSQETSYLKDSRGIGSGAVERMIESVKEWVRTMFATQEYVRSLERRIIALENPNLDDTGMALKLYESGFEAEYGDVSCNNDVCIRSIN